MSLETMIKVLAGLLLLGLLTGGEGTQDNTGRNPMLPMGAPCLSIQAASDK
jgi:hypothetical protein